MGFVEDVAARCEQARAEGRPTALGAYIFAGAFSLGAEAAGFSVLGHVEDPGCAVGFEASRRRGWPVLDSLPRQDWHRVADDLLESGVQLDLLYANPPCSAFSRQGAGGGMDDPVMDCTRACVDLCLQLQPRAFVWESVEGLFDDEDGRAFLEQCRGRLNASGYECTAYLTSSGLHGGYQNRVRFHLIACKFPLLLERAYAAEPPERKVQRLLGDALRVVEEAEAAGVPMPNHSTEKVSGGQLLSILQFCPPGGYLREVHSDLMRAHYRPYGKEWDGKSRAGVAQCRGRRDRVCPVITGGHSVVHPERDRFLTIREAATCMGFPLDYQFSSGSAGYAEVGKGLTVHTASFVCRAIEFSRREWDARDDDGDPMVVQRHLLVHDWRSRHSVESLPPTPEERLAWWRARHPDKPEELHLPWKQKQGGRPKGSRNRARGEGEEPSEPGDSRPLLLLLGELPGGRREALARLGVEVSLPSEPWSRDSIDAVLASYPANVSMAHALGVAYGLGVPLLVLCPQGVAPDVADRFGRGVEVRELASDATPAAMSMAVAEALGMDMAAAARTLVSAMSPEDIIAMVLRGGQ